MTVPAYLKDPADKLDYGFDYADATHRWLAAGETISASTWAVSPTGTLTIASSPAHSNTTTTTTVWLTGGTDGANYKVTNHIVTSSGREIDRTMTILVRQR